MEKLPIIALDFTGAEAKQFLKQFDEHLFVKVGMELFYESGPPIIQDIKAMGHKVFLDLKLHDIPTTVQKAMKQLAALDVDLVNVHAAGGVNMMKAAVKGLNEGCINGKRPEIIAVTQLTSTSEQQMQNEQQIQLNLIQSVQHYAGLAKQAGLDGIVCAATDCRHLISELGSDFKYITPGIRPKGTDANDQVRTATPAEAAQLGASAIVVGRAITGSEDPTGSYRQIKKEWSGTDE
ncbi:orotidine-5'-phosphate decarboxylase [Jeotgalibacillus haloalkalitolerans]|uniref:Orotidine 5'-phosphate decarboxylase n=1 Tax=Jeotgalibacillus haloalkalitolerans TaxID=3104292 RepID=A0ABU5KJZ9_9BACL|nr:orotidine-5'-phosphate decarboxylase [Jeotgalibacillus sp. HH7-29]MDZ5711594.1 orotidine-5'-phosphate decarboxylase [Jeotgalibacillus sp. HH7-29]